MPDTLPTFEEWLDQPSKDLDHYGVTALWFGFNACRDLALPLLKNERGKRDEMIDYSRRLEAEIERLRGAKSKALAILNDERLIDRIGATDGIMIATGRIGNYEGPTLDDAREALTEKDHASLHL